MPANRSYELDFVPPGRRSRWRRSALAAVLGILSMGEPVVPGGGEVWVIDKLTGRVLGKVVVPFGDDGFTKSRMEEDLLVLSEESFTQKWIGDA